MIDPNAVTELLGSCLSENGAIVEGIVSNFGIDVEKAKKDEAVIKTWIADLPTEFLFEGGGGWSFLNLCQTKDGEQWTGLHRACEALYVLSRAIGCANILLPRSLWGALPGGVPYLAFTLEPEKYQKELA